MRAAGRVALGLAGFALALGVVLAWALPTLVEGAGLRERLDAFSRERIGRGLSYAGFSLGFLPPRIEVTELAVGADGDADPPAFWASQASFLFAWRPLFAGRVVVDSLVIDGAEVRVVRTTAGVDWLGAALPAAPAAPALRAGSGAARSRVALKRVTLRQSRILVADRAVAPPLDWQLDAVRLDATSSGATGEAADFQFELAGQLQNGGVLRADGRVAASGEVVARADLSKFHLAPLASYVEALDRSSGTGSLALEVERAGGGAFSFDLSAATDDLDAGSGETTARGGVKLEAQLRWRDGGLEGPYTLDLTGAVLDVSGGVIHKARGEPGRLSGRVRMDQAGTRSDFHLELRNLGADGAFRSEPRFRIEAGAPPFDLAGWETVVPALEGLAPTGALAISELIYTEAPARLNGTVGLQRIVLKSRPSGKALEVSGFLDADGTNVTLRSASASAGGARLALEGGVSDVFGKREANLRVRTPMPVESNAVFSLVDGLEDSIFGPLTLELVLALPDAGAPAETPALERLRGTFQFEIGAGGAGGRIQGGSVLQRVFGKFGVLGDVGLHVLPAKRGKSLEEYYSEDFREAGGAFRVGDGWARTDDLHVIHEQYRTHLRGGLRLGDLALDMRGEVVIGAELDAVLSGAAQGRERVIPLVRVGGTLTDPTIALRDEDVSRFLAHYALSGDTKLGRKIDKALGAGASELLREMLGGAER